jgi:hypothetical protein
VPTIIAFRTLAEAQRTHHSMESDMGVRRLGEVLIMMPLKKAVRADEGRHLQDFSAPSTGVG